MKTVTISTNSISEYTTFGIGERGENEVSAISFDFGEWIEEYGDGALSLYVKRSGDKNAYPVALQIEDTIATWNISDVDTANKGRGEAELVYVSDGKIEKSAVFGFVVKRDIGEPSDTPPDPYESWLDTLAELGSQTQENANLARASADEAKESADSAAESLESIGEYTESRNSSRGRGAVRAGCGGSTGKRAGDR